MGIDLLRQVEDLGSADDKEEQTIITNIENVVLDAEVGVTISQRFLLWQLVNTVVIISVTFTILALWETK